MTPDAFEIARKKFFGDLIPVPAMIPAGPFEAAKPSEALSADEYDDLLARQGSQISNTRVEVEVEAR